MLIRNGRLLVLTLLALSPLQGQEARGTLPGLPEARLAVSIAKAHASDAYREVGNKGIQCHGGMDFTWENGLHLYYRRAKASELAFGDATYHRERIARLVIDKL